MLSVNSLGGKKNTAIKVSDLGSVYFLILQPEVICRNESVYLKDDMANVGNMNEEVCVSLSDLHPRTVRERCP